MPLSTGIPALDELLGGGILENRLTLLYGEAGSGKSGLMMQIASTTVSQDSKTIYIQTDSAFPSERFQQIAGSRWEQVVERVPILELADFNQQERLAETLQRYLTPSVKLVLWDTFTSLYRTALGTSRQNVLLNRSLNRQLALLLELARQRRIAIILAAQLRGVVNTPENGDEEDSSREAPVAEKVLDYWTETRLKLQKLSQLNQRRLIIERHPSIETPSSITLQTSPRGLELA